MIELKNQTVIASNAETGLLDMGDGIACLEFRSKGNSISPLVREFILETLTKRLGCFDGLIIANQGKMFSAGADLTSIRQRIEDHDFAELEKRVRSFQSMTSQIKRCPKPVVAAPFHMTLGGGLEITLHSHAKVALSKCYMGLVEIGVGLIPGGGGTKQSAIIAASSDEKERNSALLTVFQKLLCRTVSKSGDDARRLLYLTEDDVIVNDMEDLIPTAKQKCLELTKRNRVGGDARSVELPGKQGYDLLMDKAAELRERDVISPYDLELAKILARVLCGSSTDGPALYTEGQLLELEAQGFLEAAHHRGTYDRIVYFLENNKMLRN